MIRAVLEYLAERFPLFPNVVGAVLMFAGPSAVGAWQSGAPLSARGLSIALVAFVLALLALRLADDLIDFAPDCSRSRRRAMQTLAAVCAAALSIGSIFATRGWLLVVFLIWLLLVSSTLNMEKRRQVVLLWAANEPMYLPLLLFAYFSGAGPAPLSLTGVGVVVGSWLLIESWEIARKSLRGAGAQPSSDIYTQQYGKRAVRVLFCTGYTVGALLLGLVAQAASIAAMGGAIVLGTAVVCAFISRSTPINAVLSFFVLSNLELAMLVVAGRWN